MPSKESKEFSERKELLRLKKEFEKYKHRLAMDELNFRRDSNIMHHNMELERLRIKSAEIKRTINMRDR